MALRLIIEDEEGATTIVPLTDEEITIGREAGNTIQLTEQNVSRQHARLSLGPDGWVLEDLDSYNGVKVNNVPVDASVTLMEGDLVQIGDYHLALSENVERTTLNLDRPLEAANTPSEPFQVAPSVDLPRLSEREMAELKVAAPEPAAAPKPAIAPTPIPTPTPLTVAPAVDEDEDEERKRGAGMWVVIIVLLLAAVGVGGYFATQGSGGGAATTIAKKPDKPEKANAATPADSADAGDPGQESAAEADAGQPQDDSAGEDDSAGADAAGDADSAGEDDSAGEGSEGGDSAEPDDDSAGEEPEDDSAGDAGPKTPKKKKETKPKADPAELLQQARTASLGGNASKAYKLAKQSYKIDKNKDALTLMGMSACKMGDAKKAQSVYSKLSGGIKSALASVCSKNGVELK